MFEMLEAMDWVAEINASDWMDYEEVDFDDMMKELEELEKA